MTPTDSKTEQSIRDNGKDHKDMDMVSKSGLMELVMKVNGEEIKRMGEESFGMSMVTSSTESGRTTKLMGTVFTLM